MERGWERAVETVLGSYLEAVCVDGLDSVTDLLASFDGGHLAVVSTERRRGAARARCGHAAGEGAGRAAVLGSVLSSVYTAETLGEALQLRRGLAAGRIGRHARWNLAGQRTGCGCRATANRTPA